MSHGTKTAVCCGGGIGIGGFVVGAGMIHVYLFLWFASAAIPFVIWANLCGMFDTGFGIFFAFILGLIVVHLGLLGFFLFAPTCIFAGWKEIKQSWGF